MLPFPALLIGQNVQAQKTNRPKKGFVIKATESRFNEKTLIGGKNPNDIKVSQKDTNGDLTVFEYTGNEKGGASIACSSTSRRNIFYRSR